MAAAPNGRSKSAPGVLFAHEVRKDGRRVAILRGVESDAGGVTVEAEVFPVASKPDAEPRRRPFAFATREQALRFVADALDSLEYLGGVVVE
jgi:hypothetical protein